jgi:integrating conjugative element protein (TIGR03755 family)
MKNLLLIKGFCIAAACLLPATFATAQTQEVPRSNSSLYYRIGGGSPAAAAANPGTIALKLGFSSKLNANYTCGKFDLGASWSNLMNGFSSLGTQITGAVKAGISALPLYILQRAQPGLYELFQTYAKKAEIGVSAALDSCEQMEAQIKQGQDPYAKWIALAKGEGWTREGNTNNDVVKAKSNVESDNGSTGVTWLGNVSAGGVGQPSIRPINDMMLAGYNVTMKQPVTASNTANYSSANVPLTKAFPRPQDAANFAVEVLGDKIISTCDKPSCAPKGAVTATGLQLKYETEIPSALTQINTAIASSNPTYASLTSASAPGVSIATDVVRAIRELPADIQAISAQKLAKEVALARTIDKALTIRGLLITGMTLPEAQKFEPAVTEARARIETLNTSINNLLFESRVRREIVSDTSGTLIQAYQLKRSSSAPVGTQQPVDTNIMSDGRVK